MLVHVPALLLSNWCAPCAVAARRGRLDRWPRHRRPPIRPSQGQPAAARRSSGRARARRHGPGRAPAKSAVHVGGAAAPRLPAALQSLRRRAGLRQSRRQRHPPGIRQVAPDSHRSVRNAVPRRAGRIRRRRTAWSRTPTACTRQAARPATSCCIPRRSLHHVPPSRAARASPRSSGFRAWSATTASGRCCSISIPRSSELNADVPDHPAAVQLTGVYHNLLRRWADL